MTPQIYISSPDILPLAENSKVLPTRFLILEQTLQIQHYNLNVILLEMETTQTNIFLPESGMSHSQFLLFPQLTVPF